MCCTRLAENIGHKNYAKKSPYAHHRTTLSGYIFATKAYIDNQKKNVKQQYVLHMSPQYGELRPINSWDLLASLGHPSKFQRVSRLAFVTAVTSLTGGQPNFAQCLAVSWVPTLTEFCPVQNSLYFQVLLSRILAALLHGTPAAGISQTLWHGTRNGITKLLQRVPPIFGRAAITLGIGPHCSFLFYDILQRFLYFYKRCKMA